MKTGVINAENFVTKVGTDLSTDFKKFFLQVNFIVPVISISVCYAQIFASSRTPGGRTLLQFC
jgi:hypothetical protein